MAEVQEEQLSPEEVKESTETWRDFRQEQQHLQRSLGTRQQFPEEPTEVSLLRSIQDLRGRQVVTGFHELTNANRVHWTRRGLQFAGDLAKPERSKTFHPEEFILSQQLATYNVSLTEITQYISTIGEHHEHLQDLIAALPIEDQRTVAKKRKQSVVYMRALTGAINERVAFANVWRLDQTIAELNENLKTNPNDEPTKKRRDEFVAARKQQFDRLSPMNQRVLTVGVQDGIKDQANALEARIIKICAGKEKIEGVDDGFLPQTLFIDILQMRYTQLIKAQSDFVRDGGLRREGGRVAFDAIDAERKGMMGEIVALTHELAGYHQRMAEITTAQGLLGKFNTDLTPESGELSLRPKERVELAGKMGSIKRFHLDRLDAAVKTSVDEFTPGNFEKIRDGIVRGTITATQLSMSFAKLIGAITPGALGLDKKVEEFLVGPMADALGWPRDNDGKFKATLSEDEKKVILDKLGQLTKVLQTFQDSKKQQPVLETTAALRALDTTKAVSDTRIGQVQEPVPTVRVTAANLEATLAELEKKYGNREDAVATVHAILITQLNADWGDPDKGTGFIGAYATMLKETERIVSVQLDVAGACFQMSQNFFDIAKFLVVSAGAVAIAPYVMASLSTAGVLVKYGIIKPGKFIYNRLRPSPLTPGKVVPRATRFQRFGYVAANGFLAYELYENYREIGREHERLNKVKGDAEAALIKAGFKKDNDTYKHACGAKVSIKEFNESLDSQRNAQYFRTGVIATELGTALLMGPRLLIGRGGLVLTAIALVIEGGIASWESKEARDFLANPNTPPWLITMLGTSRLVKQPEYKVLVNTSSWNVIPSSEQDKKTVRKKMYFAMFMQEIGSLNPDMLREITAGHHNITELDNFFGGDFEKFVLPSIFLFMYADAKAKGRDVSQLAVMEGKIDSGWVVIPPNITEMEIQGAIRKAATLYQQHIREQRNLLFRKRLADATAELEKKPDDAKLQTEVADLRRAVELMNNDKVLGAPLSGLTDEQVKTNEGKTRAEKLLAYLLKRTGEGKPDMRVEASGIQGLPKDSFSLAGDELYALCVEDPSLRTRFARLTPQTTDQPEGELTPDWYRRFMAPIIAPGAPDDLVPFGRPVKAFERNIRRGAVRDIQGSIDEKERGNVPDNVTTEKAKEAQTEELAKAIAKQRGENPTYTSKWDNIGRIGYDGPLLERQEHTGKGVNGAYGLNVAQYGKEFERTKQLAVFTEVMNTKAGNQAALLTYVFGDATDINKMYIVQVSWVDYDFVNDEADFYGLSASTLRKQYNDKKMRTSMPLIGRGYFSGGSEFAQKQTGGRTMLELVKKMAAERKKEEDEYIARRAKERMQREKEDEEKRRLDNLPPALRSKERDGVLLRAGETADTYSLLPGADKNAASSYVAFVQLPGGRTVIAQRPVPYRPYDGASMSALPENGMHDPSGYMEWTVTRGNDKPTKVILSKENSLTDGKDPDAARLRYAMLTMPFPPEAADYQHEETFNNVLSMFRWEYKRNSPSPRAYIYRDLFPLYQACKNKQRFLQELVAILQRYNGMTFESYPKIIEHMKKCDRENQFATKMLVDPVEKRSIALPGGYILTSTPARVKPPMDGTVTLSLTGPKQGSITVEGCRVQAGDKPLIQIEDLGPNATVTIKDGDGKVIADKISLLYLGTRSDEPIYINPACPPSVIFPRPGADKKYYMRLGGGGMRWASAKPDGTYADVDNKSYGTTEGGVCSCVAAGGGEYTLGFWQMDQDPTKTKAAFTVLVREMK